MNPRIEWLLKRPAYQRGLMLLGLMALISAAFVFGVFMPMVEEFEELQKRNNSLLAKVQEDQRIAADLPKFKAEYEKMKAQLDLSLAQLPNQKEIPTLLSSIASVAKDNGLEVLRFSPGQETPKGFYAEVPVSLKLKGSYHQVAMFFYAVGNLSRIVNIGNVTMSSAGEAGGEVILSIDCLATTFRFLESNEQAPKGKK